MKPPLLACGLLASAVAGTGLAIWLSPHDAGPEHGVALDETAAPASGTPGVAPAPLVGETAVGQPADLDGLRTACPSLMWELTEECAAALEHRFGSESIPPRLPLMPEATIGDVFAVDEATLAKVEAALSRPECRVPPGRFRADLREPCAADDMAMLAQLHWRCGKWVATDPDGSKRWETEAMLEEARWDVEPRDPDWLDEENYLRIRENNETMAYSQAWRYHKCRPLRRVLEWRGLVLGHVRDISAGPPNPFLLYGGDDKWLSDPLLEAAARVGSEFALMQLLRVDGELEDEAMAGMFAEFETRNPTLAQAKLVQITRKDTKMLAHAMAAQMLAPLQGVTAQWPWRWTKEGAWEHGRGGGWRKLDADKRQEATEEAKRIVARIAGQRGWDATALDWSKVAAPMDLPAERD